LFEQRERIAPRKLKQRELDQREQQLLRRKGFIRMRIVSKMRKVSTRIQNPRHTTARRVGYIGADGENQKSWQGSTQGKQRAEDNRMSQQGSTEGTYRGFGTRLQFTHW
jgi:hypothetical protein